jgi:CheY-like chemotaxis protein
MANVLVVDDDLACRVLAALLLEYAGHSPTAVASVDRALERLATRDADVILTDLHMPGRGGLDLLEVLSERESTVPVVVMTGSADGALLQRALELGAVSILRKPFERAQLEVAVCAAVGSAATRPHAA